MGGRILKLVCLFNIHYVTFLRNLRVKIIFSFQASNLQAMNLNMIKVK